MTSKRLRRLQRSADASNRTAAMESLQVTPTEPSPPIIDTVLEDTETGPCNMFMIQLEPKQQVWRYDVQIELCRSDNADGKQLKRSLTKGSGDGQRALNRKICFNLLKLASTRTNNFGMSANASFVYDNKAILYTSQPIQIEKQQLVIGIEEVDKDFTKAYCSDSRFNVEVFFVVEIVPSETGHLLNLGAPLTDQEEGIPIRTFLEMATSQEAVNRKTFSAIGPGKLYHTDAEKIESMNNGIELRPGLKKGVRIVSNNGNPCPAVVLDSKTSPFFKSQNLLQTIKEVNGGRLPVGGAEWTHVLSVLQDLRVEPIYARNQSFEIGSFTEKPVNKIRVPTSDYSVLYVPTYFESSRKISLEYPELPGVLSNRPAQAGKSMATYPIELLEVMPDQRVPLEKMNKKLSDKLLESNSVHPNIRLANVIQRAEQLALFSPSNKILSSFGVKVIKESNEVVIGVRHPPEIQFRDGITKTTNPVTTRWNNYNALYISTKKISHWLFYYPKKQEKTVCDFKAKFVQEAIKKGMCFITDDCPYMVPYQDNSFNLKSMFGQCVTRKIEFMLFIDSERNDTHADLKYYEARFKILTQHITTEVVENVVKNSQNQTLENILHKTNCKNFGLNYIPVIEPLANEYALESGQVLAIGLDVSHPPPAKKADRRMLYTSGYKDMDSLEPSVVGICANMAAHPHAFVGDYFYQQSRKESIDVSQLEERIQWIMEILKTNRPNHSRPKYVFILRDGVSEGQYKMAITEEYAAIQAGFQKADPDYKPQILYVVGTKRHFKRFFSMSSSQSAQNCPPGSVIQNPFSSRLVENLIGEAWMVSHKAVKTKSTSKAVQYALLKDEIGIGMGDPLLAFLNSLCYSHQISNGAISLPEPIYQADALAGRGAKNYGCLKKNDPTDIPRMDSPMEKAVDVQKLTKLLSYKGSFLNSTRFTA